jgi:hypothetical protein
VLGRTFGPKWDELAGEWRRLHNEELRNLYALPNIVRVVVVMMSMILAGHVSRTGDIKNTYKNLGRKT